MFQTGVKCSHNAGALRCLSALIPPYNSSLDQQEASQRLCTDLAHMLADVVSIATASKGQAADLAAIEFLAVFARHASADECALIFRRDPSAHSASLITRLVSLCMLDGAGWMHAACLLRQITRKLPTYAREALQSLLANIGIAETSGQKGVAVQALVATLKGADDGAPSTGVYHEYHDVHMLGARIYALGTMTPRLA
jgi:hypothetical protein